MKVIIMCGGKGTRLREETSVKPKPMVEIGGRPVLWHIMSIYARFGFKKLEGVEMPPPTNPDRVLGLDLKAGAWDGETGVVTKAT